MVFSRWEQSGKASNRVEVPGREGLSAYELSRAVTRVRQLRKTDKAVLRSLADHYPSIWPSLETIGEESGLRETATRLALKRLVKDGWIKSLGSDAGGRYRTRQYAINVDKILSESENPSPRQPFTGAVALTYPSSGEPFQAQYENSSKQNPSSRDEKGFVSRAARVRLASQKGSSGEPEVIIKEISKEIKEENSAFVPFDLHKEFSQLVKEKRIAPKTDEERKQHAEMVRQQAAQLRVRS